MGGTVKIVKIISMIIKAKIKPLSVNKAWQGRRFKTKDYIAYEKELLLILPKKKMIKGLIEVHIVVFFKNVMRADSDNILKPILDICQKKGYYENDNKIMILSVEKKKSENEGFIISIENIK